jgi:hypothetical protein
MKLLRTDRANGQQESTPAEGATFASTLQRIAKCEGGTGTVEECAAIARRLFAGEVIATVSALYEVRS